MSGTKATFTSIRGTVEWATVHKPKQKYQSTEKEFSVTLQLDGKPELEAELRALLKTHGVTQKIKTVDKEGNPVPHTFTFKQSATKKDGTPNSISVTDASGKNKVPSSVLIGNGSEAVIHFMISAPFMNSSTGKMSSVIRLTGLQVTKLVAYESKARGFDAVDGDFVVDTSEESSIGSQDLDTSVL